MKKILLGTSALAAVALTAGSATAEAPTQTLDGGIEYSYVFYGNDTDGVSSRGNDIVGNGWRNELHWTISGVADNGLEYTGRVDWRYTSGLDESWIKLGGGWGTVYLGNDDAASENVVDANSIAAAGGGVDGYYFWSGAMDTVGDAATMDFYGGTGDAAKISYYSPDFSGFGVGVSFTPTSANGNGSTAGLDTNLSRENGVDAIVTYNGEFGGVGVSLGGGYKMAEVKGAAGVELEDLGEFHLGGIVTVADFSFAAGFMDMSDSATVKGANADAGSGYNLGVGYTMGDIYLSAVYTAMESDRGGNGVDDELTAWSVGANYDVAEGLRTFAEVGQMETDDGADTSTDGSNTATIFLIGTKVSF